MPSLVLNSHRPELLSLLRELEFEYLLAQFTPPQPGVVEIYSDGSGSEQGPGGYGAALRYGASEKELSGFELATTSQRMELSAICGLLEAAKPHAVAWEWVKGHSGSPFNERADALAGKAAQQAKEILCPKQSSSSEEQVAEAADHPVVIEQQASIVPSPDESPATAAAQIEVFESEEDGQLVFF